MSQVHLLFCHKLKDRAGTTTQAIRLAKALSKENRVYLCGEGMISLEDVTVINIPTTSSPIQFLKIAVHEIQKLDLDLSHVKLLQAFDPIYTGPTVLYLARLFQSMSVLRIGAVYEDFYASRLVNKIGIPATSSARSIFTIFLRIFLKISLRKYTCVYANCNFLADHYTKLAKTQVYSIPNIVYQQTTSSRKQSATNGLKLLFVGRIEARKNVDDLILALARLRGKVGIDKVTFVGSLDKEPWYSQAMVDMADKKLSDWISNVNFTGFQSPEQLAFHYLNHDLLLFPTNSKHFPITEGMPNVIIESLSFGTPAMATNVAGVKQILSPDLHDFLIDPDNVIEEMARKIAWFAELNQETRSEFSEYGIKKIYSYNPENILRYYMSIVKKVGKKGSLLQKNFD